MAKKRAKPSTKQEQQPLPVADKFSLYDLLQLEKGSKSSTDEIKKQYRKLVIKYHPDKNQGDNQAREKFQKLKEAFDILIDPERKKVYDETGSIGDQFNENAFQSAYQYYRTQFKKIQEQDILDFQKKYRYGQMERQDLLDFYQSHKGNMITLLECIPLSRNQDIERFIEFFEENFASKKLQKSKDFDKTKGKVRKLKDQTQQFDELEKQEKKSGMEQLVLAIRNKPGNSYLDALEKKYCQKPKKTKVEKEPKDANKRIKKTKK